VKTRRIIHLLAVLLILLSACKPFAVPSLTPTSYTAATSSAVPSLVLGNFSAVLKSKGVHGGMACYTYDGNPEDLEGVTLTARFLRGEVIIEKRIPSEIVDGENCFEMTDAKYLSISPNEEGGRINISDQPLSIRIDARVEDNREISNNYQTLDLGRYIQFPFLGWIFPEDSAPGCLAGGHKREGVHYPAWDLISEPTENYPAIVGTPVLAPVDGFFYLTSFSKDDDPHQKVNTVMIYSPDTGFLVDLTHMYELVNLDGEWIMLEELVGKEVSAGEQIGVIAPKDFVSTVPHAHLQILVPPKPINNNRRLTTGEMNEIYVYLIDNKVPNLDFIAEKMFLDENLNDKLVNLSSTKKTCEITEWGEISFPQQLPFRIDGNANDWGRYEAALSEAAADNPGQELMDLSALTLAMDENYLYMMLDAGIKPEEVNAEWTFYLHLDLFKDNSCGSSDRILKIDSEYLNEFEVYSLDKCDSTLSARYPLDFAWNEVLEIKIHRAYLRNPSKVSALQVTGYLTDPLDQHIIQDQIP